MDNIQPRLIVVTERRKSEAAPPVNGGRRLDDAVAKTMSSCDRVGEACDALGQLLARAGG